MYKEEPMKFISAMLIKMGEMCVETNAATIDLKQESTLSNVRYEIQCKILVKKVKPSKLTPSSGNDGKQV